MVTKYTCFVRRSQHRDESVLLTYQSDVQLGFHASLPRSLFWAILLCNSLTAIVHYDKLSERWNILIFTS